MNNTTVVARVSRETGVDPLVCLLVIKSLERVMQEELGSKPGAGVLNRIAEFVLHMTSFKRKGGRA